MGFEPTSRLRDYLISSQGRYDLFDTCPYIKFLYVKPTILTKLEIKAKFRAKQASFCEMQNLKTQVKSRLSVGRSSLGCITFRVRAVMTSSIPVRIEFCVSTAFILYMTLHTLSSPFKNFPQGSMKKFPSKTRRAETIYSFLHALPVNHFYPILCFNTFTPYFSSVTEPVYVFPSNRSVYSPLSNATERFSNA